MLNTWLPYHFFNFSREHPLFLNTVVKQKSADRACINLMTRLQSSMQPSELLSIFRQELRKYLPICGLTFQSKDDFYTTAIPEVGLYGLNVELVIEGYAIGQLEYEFEEGLSAAQKKLLTQLSDMFSFAFRNALKYQKMKKLALKDSLTGLNNRNKFEVSFNDSVRSSQKKDSSFSLLVLDLDGFKKVNDKFGHQTGDLVLTRFAQVLLNCSRDEDLVFRFGGDEFTILLNDANKASVPDIASRIKKAVSQNHLLAQLNVSCSMGSAHYHQGDDKNTLFERADQALYRAKNKGKNCIELSSCF